MMTDQRRRLLFLAPFAPRLDATHGGGRAIAQLLASLALRHHVALLYLRASDEPPLDDCLREQCEYVEEILRPAIGNSFVRRWVYRWRLLLALLHGVPIWAVKWRVPAYARRVRAVARWWRPEIVHIEYHIMAQYLPALDDCTAQRMLIEYEPGVAAARDLLLSEHGFAFVKQLIDLLAWMRFEPSILRKIHVVVVLTERDRCAIKQLAPQTWIEQIPLGATLPEHPLRPLGLAPPSLLFVGSFIHPANVDAAIRLISRIFPQVQAHYPELMLYVVGDQPPPHICQLASDHIVITGRVPDVLLYLDRATLVVVPVRLGGGMRVKVLEALAAGKPVVVSRLAIEGLDLVDGDQVILAESDQEFCEGIINLLAMPERRAALAAQARTWACAHLNWEQRVEQYERLYRALLAEGR